MRRWGRKEDAAHFANVRKVLTEGKKKKKYGRKGLQRPKQKS